MQSSAILILAYGGPDSLDDIPAFLREVHGSQSVPQSLIDETTRRYRLIGGRSPLLAITRQLAVKLQTTIALPVYIGMRHWHPYIADTVQEMTRVKITRATVICLAPHFSPMSVGAYHAALNEAILSLRGTQFASKHPPNSPFVIPEFDFIEAWHRQPHYIHAVAQNIRVALAQLGPNAKIIFTAPSVPASARMPYESQLRETARLVAQNLEWQDERWLLAYQGAPRSSTEWLEPALEKTVLQLARAGEKNLLIAPIGFVADHVQVLYDIDIALQEIARVHGVRLERMPMLNDSDGLVNALATLVRERNQIA